jgi:hypothetical protein
VGHALIPRIQNAVDFDGAIVNVRIELRDTVSARFGSVIEPVIEDLGFLDRVRTKDT